MEVDMAASCPGMNPANWKIEDIFESPCPSCGASIEFWKDDIKRRCSCCRVNFNPRLGNLCLSWCDRADDCLGNQDILEWKAKLASGELHQPGPACD
jgi:hypothetical protein